MAQNEMLLNGKNHEKMIILSGLWICGFSNAQGGYIYIGINDNGNVIGLSNSRKLLEDIPNKVRDTLGIISYRNQSLLIT